MENLKPDEPAMKKLKISGDEFQDMKSKLRERKKNLIKIPRLRMLTVGENAMLNVKEENRVPIFLNDLQHLLLYSIMGNRSPYLPDRWCKLDKYNQVSHVVVCIVEGLTLNHYTSNRDIFQQLSSKFDYELELISPTIYGGSIIEELAAVPLTGIERFKLMKKFGSLETALEKNTNIIKLFKAIFPMQVGEFLKLFFFYFLTT